VAGKILYVIGNLDVGGAERHLVQNLPRLAEQGFKLSVYTITHKGKLASVLEDAGIEVVEPCCASFLRGLPKFLQKPLLLSSSIPSFCYQVLLRRPSIIHFFLPEAYLLGGLSSLLLGRRIRIMSRRSLNRYQLKHPFLAKIERRLHAKMDAVLGNSTAVVYELQAEGVALNRLGLLYNGIDLTQFDELPTRNALRKSIGLNDETLLMVCVANLIPYKGHVDLIRALGGISAQLPKSWAIAMVGRDAGTGEELRGLAESLGVGRHILWLGERSDAVALYSAADIGVLSSHQEGFSNSVLEGMAAKVAMVVTDVGGNAEAVLDGECGIVVPVRNPEVLGKAILTLANDEEMRKRMAAAGSRRVKQHFTVATCVNRYANLYSTLLKESRPHIQRAIDLAPEKASE